MRCGSRSILPALSVSVKVAGPDRVRERIANEWKRINEFLHSLIRLFASHSLTVLGCAACKGLAAEKEKPAEGVEEAVAEPAAEETEASQSLKKGGE